MSPLDPKARELWHNVPALMFMDFWQSKNRRIDLRELARMLGVLWLREDVEKDESMSGVVGSIARPNELTVPLACVVEPGIMDVVKQYFGKRMGIDPPGWAMAQKSETIEMFGSSKEEFLKFIRGFVSPKVS
jgi:hypothetical protein